MRGKPVVVLCDRICAACRHADCIQEHMSTEEIRESVERDEEIKKMRTRRGDPPPPMPREQEKLLKREYMKEYARAAREEKLREGDDAYFQLQGEKRRAKYAAARATAGKEYRPRAARGG